MHLRVAFLAAECEPWAKTGGLADVVDGLARALGRLPDADPTLSTPVDVFLPRYRGVRMPRRFEVEPPLTIDDPAGTGPLTVSIIDVAADGYRLRLVDHPQAFDRDGFYDHPDDAWRFAVFGRAAFAALRRDGEPVDVLHAHDWHTGPALIDRERGAASGDPFYRDMAAVLTLHNLAYRGRTPAAKLGLLGLAPGDPLAGDDPEVLDLLRAAVEHVDLANTVSPGFAREALTPEFGRGLDGLFRAMGDRFSGILNGIDPEVWDPATDSALAAPYRAGAMDGKAACRRNLLERVGFDPDDDGAVLAMIGRLDPQKGFDLLADGAPELLEAGARLIVLGSGRASLADPFRELAAAARGRVAMLERFDRDLARQIYAGADLFLMPSRFEPCGQGQMIALRYGTPPVVRRTGGLADSVVDVDEQPAHGTGFVFDEASPAALVAAVTRAMALRAGDRDGWATLVARGMAVDFAWDTGPAPRYLELYRRAVQLRRGA
jgi:starch synthase